MCVILKLINRMNYSSKITISATMITNFIFQNNNLLENKENNLVRLKKRKLFFILFNINIFINNKRKK